MAQARLQEGEFCQDFLHRRDLWVASEALTRQILEMFWSQAVDAK